MKKPTPKMIEVLRKLAEPGVYARYMPYMGRLNPSAYYYIAGLPGRCTSAMMGLENRGLVERFDHSETNHGYRVRINAAGREWLSSQTATASRD